MDFLDQLIDLFALHGYLAVFAALLISAFGVPIPEDISLVAGGVIAALGHADVRVMCVVGLVGVLLGDAIVFLFGRVFGVHALRWGWVARLLTPRRHAQVKAKFTRYGNRLMFVARFLPGLRTAVFLTAGMSHRVSFLRFLAFDGLAALLSVPFWVWLGYIGAEHRDWLLAQVHRGQGAIAVVAVVLLALTAWWFWRRAQERHQRLRSHRERRAERSRP